MKQTVYSSGMIPTTDDLDFEARAKNLAIEQTRYDLLEQQGTFVKGVVQGSGMTSSHTDDPLKVYLEGLVVNIYSGVAYDSFERRARPVSYTHLRAHETLLDLVCRLLLAKKKIMT